MKGRFRKHPGNSAIADPLDQASYLLALLCELGGRGLWPEVIKGTTLSEDQVKAAARHLNARGYIAIRIRMDRKLVYSVTILGWSAAETAAKLEAWVDQP